MTDRRTDTQAVNISHTTCMQLDAVEQVLDALVDEGMRLSLLPGGDWRGEWHRQSGVAPGWGSALTEALDWYSGHPPAPSVCRAEEWK